MSWQRPNIGSRVTREGHARFWERPEVKFLRATQQKRRKPVKPRPMHCPLRAEIGQLGRHHAKSALCHKRTHAPQQTASAWRASDIRRTKRYGTFGGINPP